MRRRVEKPLTFELKYIAADVPLQLPRNQLRIACT